MQEVRREGAGYDYVFLSPIFDSVSKQGYQAAFEPAELRALLPAPCPVIALGGEAFSSHHCMSEGKGAH